MRSNVRNQSGFTLVEIMIVVMIIAMLTAIAIPSILRSKVNANHANAQTTLKAIGTALESYSIYNTTYPNDTDLLVNSTPSYLNVDYFSGSFSGYTYTASTLSNYSYTVQAIPISSTQGTVSYSITTGGVLSVNP